MERREYSSKKKSTVRKSGTLKKNEIKQPLNPISIRLYGRMGSD
jgi:hypothetical protein